jgi:hypothetical protein
VTSARRHEVVGEADNGISACDEATDLVGLERALAAVEGAGGQDAERRPAPPGT